MDPEPVFGGGSLYPAYGSSMPAVLIGVGGVLIVLTFLLAFTIFGVFSAVLGIACLVVGAFMLSRQGPGAM